jgi:D-beta-D-heptose 7-phosphate kinase/D-beta-D-heptose 1-phosphate adenosyltransferase
LEAVLQRMPRVRVLVVGDLMLDQFIWGRVDRISPEAPVPVVQFVSEDFRLGGAANVVSNVRALGAPTIACGVVGADPGGRRVLALLKQVHASVAGVVASARVGTIWKTRIIAHQQQVVRIDRDQPSARLVATAASLRSRLPRLLGRTDVVIVSDYGKGMITAGLLDALARARMRHGFQLVVDPKKPNFANYRGATLITPNLAEAAAASGVAIEDASGLEEAGAVLLERWQAEGVLITRGEHGMSLFTRGEHVRHFPTVARHVYDVAGAGDTVTAACALALGAGASFAEAAVLANHAAGIVVGEVGTATVSRAALRAELRRAMT